MIAAYEVVWPTLAGSSLRTCGPSPSVRRRRFALRNGPIYRVCARGKPSARETDPIIGLSQKRIYFNSVAALFAIPGGLRRHGKRIALESIRRLTTVDDIQYSGPTILTVDSLGAAQGARLAIPQIIA